MNKKAQAADIIVFFGLAIAILIVSIIVLRVVNEIITPMAPIIGNQSAAAGAAMTSVQDSFTSWWDYAVVLLLAVNVIVLFVSCFLIDVHPAFIIVYVIAVMFLMLCGNFALDAVDSIWFHVGRASIEGTQTPMQQFIINHFQTILFGIIILSGVLMYAKFKWFGGGGSNYG
jgi:hypothetical protein